jgi:zinc transporter
MQEQMPDHDNHTVESTLWSLIVDEQGTRPNQQTADLIKQKPSQGFNWVHLQADSLDAWEDMRKLGFKDETCDALCALETRPRTIPIDGGILVYLRGINLNPDADPEDMVSIRIWFNGHTVISARRKYRKLLSVQDARTQLEKGDGPTSATQFVLELIEKIAIRISEVVDSLDDELTVFETEGGMDNTARFQLSLIRRKAAAVRRYLAPQRDALDTLYRMTDFFSQYQAFQLRDITDRMARYVEDLDLAKERAMVLQDELRNRIAEQQGMRMYVLSLVTAIFLPLSFLTGIFGMNVAGLPGTENPGAFTYLSVGMVIVAIVVLILMLWKKWL